MMLDRAALADFLEAVADKYTGPEIVDLLDLDVWVVINALTDEIVEGRNKLEL